MNLEIWRKINNTVNVQYKYKERNCIYKELSILPTPLNVHMHLLSFYTLTICIHYNNKKIKYPNI